MRCMAAILILTMTSPVVAQEATALKKGEIAPYTGLLMSNRRVTELLEAEIERDKLKGQLRVEQRYAEGLDLMYREQLLRSSTPPSWWQSSRFQWWFGFTIGVVATGMVIYGSVEVYKAIK